ncbi:PepSY domain-containing protein [Cytobacillus horneckiae]|uniref:PepSY domain-containing protein n=1 Tax=Cytobacillus horneckiae TaxID=549687 RepID=UPI003D1F6603
MRKKLVAGLISVAVVFGGVYAVSAVENNKQESPAAAIGNDEAKKATSKQTSELITIEKVADIALNEQSGEVVDIELDAKRGNAIYEIEIQNKGKEADVKLDAFTGEVLSVKSKQDDDDDDTALPFEKGVLNINKAIKLAEEETSGKVKEVNINLENGTLIYDFELKGNKDEVELTLDAKTGEVLDVEYDD